MFSTISGQYFAGHNVPPATIPVPFNDELQYINPGSLFNNNQTLRSTTTVPYSISIFPSAVAPLTPTPAYIVIPSIVSATINGPTASVSPSSTVQRTITMWMYLPTTTVTANKTDSRFIHDEEPNSGRGLYLKASTDASKNVTLRIQMNGITNHSVFQSPSTYMPKNVWFMFTICYIINNTYPSSVWFNNTLVHQWTHGADTLPQNSYYLSTFILNEWSTRFNNYQMLGRGMTQADVSAKFAAERSYYGV